MVPECGAPTGSNPNIDIDSDDDQDLFIGNFNGNILFYENINGENYLFIEEIEGIDLSSKLILT